ncbi:MAG TPA: prepilin peptidase [Caulobacteraceae bacterium]|nr:prepilin peptidase [Caulobacteraceae bacterium]
MSPVEAAGLVFFSACLAAAAAADLRGRTIPNALPLALAAGFALYAVLLPEPAWPWRLLGGAVVLALGWLAWSLRALGGGDVKLLAAAALWFPLAAVPSFLLAVALAGGIQAVVWIFLKRAGRLQRADGRLPYALAIAAAGLWVMLRAPLA